MADDRIVLGQYLASYSKIKEEVSELESRLKDAKAAKKVASENAISMLRKLSNPNKPMVARKGRYEFKLRKKTPSKGKPSFKMLKEVVKQTVGEQQMNKIVQLLDKELEKDLQKKSVTYSLDMKEAAGLDLTGTSANEDWEETSSEVARDEILQGQLDDFDPDDG
jgi:hypothetical protein